MGTEYRHHERHGDPVSLLFLVPRAPIFAPEHEVDGLPEVVEYHRGHEDARRDMRKAYLSCSRPTMSS